MKRFKKLFLIIPLLVVGLFTVSSNKVSATWHYGGSYGPCEVEFWVDAYNYYQPGAQTVDVFLKQVGTMSCKDIGFQYAIEKQDPLTTEWKPTWARLDYLNGEFSYQSPTRGINIDEHFSGPGKYRMEAGLYLGSERVGTAYSGEFQIHY
ncbi:hypothetical protein WAK64_00960 [Bacillus spongiae]|uniref:Uncharacterized protein n=1 Tax=Bacillus spongiae TaxID=2683610 RepID=A0ABU8H8L6_9BACI